ncbi:hypothetical protein ABT236_18990 [Streptomyces sp. NPDC001523]|uniref:hypothetical protein n=1 Tax=Streptomyces sp. NPDC001523 TaxID=3154383 RepID=UPI00332E5CE4
MQRRTKIRRRDTAEAIIGGVTGALARPRLLILGRHNDAADCARSVAPRLCARTRHGGSPNA